MNKVKIHELDQDVHWPDFVKEDIVQNMVSHAAAFMVRPKFQLLKEYEDKIDRKENGEPGKLDEEKSKLVDEQCRYHIVKHLTRNYKDYFDTEEEYLDHAKKVVENVF